MPLVERGVSRGFVGDDDPGGETMDRGPAHCSVAWSGRRGVTVTSRGPAEDAGDGGLSNVSTKAS